MGLTEQAANDLGDSMLGSDHSARFPATLYLAVEHDGVEGFGGAATNYARVAVTNDNTEFPDAVGGMKTNANRIDFPTPNGDTEMCDTYSLHRHITNDDPIISQQPLTDPAQSLANEAFYVKAGDLLLVFPFDS